MARERSLLERIATGGERSRGRYQASAEQDVDALLESVRRQLERLLNARHGMSEALPNYGLPALTDLMVGSKDYQQRVEDAIRVTVESYEPRLRNVRVSKAAGDDDDGRSLSYRIDATLVTDSGQHRVWYETELSGGGYFDVSE